MGAFGATGLIIAALTILWLAVAVALSLVAARRFALAERVLSAARSNAKLLDISPARPMLVRGDGRIEADPHLLRELGLKSPPKRLADLNRDGEGLVAEDLDQLGRTIEAAGASASRVEAKVRLLGSSRVFEVRGGPAPAPEPSGTLLLWFFDTSAGEEERAKLDLRL